MMELGWLMSKGLFGSKIIKLVSISGGGLPTTLSTSPLQAESVLAVNNPRGPYIPESGAIGPSPEKWRRDIT